MTDYWLPAGVSIQRRLIFENTIDGFGQLLATIDYHLDNHKLKEVVIGAEPTSVYHKPLCEYLITMGYPVVYVTNTAMRTCATRCIRPPKWPPVGRRNIRPTLSGFSGAITTHFDRRESPINTVGEHTSRGTMPGLPLNLEA